MTSDDERTVVWGPDHTILMPTPGGQATVVLKRPEVAPTARPGPEIELQRLVAGINPLLGAANVLLGLVEQLRSTGSHADPAGLRLQLLERVREFESVARANGVPAHQISAARYVLCSFVDEVIAATPWGAGGVWAQRNLLQEFHQERSGADKSFKLLERLCEEPATNHDLLELFYVCLSLGFEGRYRGTRNGHQQLDAIAARVLELVRPAREQQATRTLSLRWQGVAAQAQRSLTGLPLWVLLALAGALVLGSLLMLNVRLDRMAEPVFKQIHALTAELQVERAATAAARPRLAQALRADVAAGSVEVQDEAQRSLLTLSADTLFERGSARIEPSRLELLGRIAQALRQQPGLVVVVGHSDDSPTASLQFPSNWHLSRERALAVAASLVQHGLPADRLRAEGRADAEPRVPNATPAGRAKNRRIEIELLLPRPDPT